MEFNFSKINKKYLFKGIIYALILMIGPILGAIMRNGGSNGYIIFGFVAFVDIIAVVGIFYLLKDDLFEKETEEEQVMRKKDKDTK